MKSPPLSLKTEELLKRHGLVPTQTFALGAGEFGQVFRVNFNGFEAAAKVIKDPVSGAKEAENWAGILEFLKSSSPEVAKHFPQVYAVIEDDETGSFIIVVELLEPLPAQIRESFFDYAKKHPPLRGVRSLISDPEIVWNAISNAEERSLDYLKPEHKEELFKKILSVSVSGEALSWSSDIGIIRRAVYKYLTNVFDSADSPSLTVNSKSKSEEESFINKMTNTISQYFTNLLKMDVPSSLLEYDDLEDMYRYSKDSPEARPVLDAMRAMKDAGINFQDIHIENLMVRPKTKDIIFSDIGLFEVP